MAKVVVTITTKPQDFPAGIAAGNIRVSVSNGLMQDVNGLTATFDSVDPGDYTVTAQLLDASNNPLGNQISVAFTIPAPANTLQVPDTINVTVS